jgi:hypothetical protein
MQERVLKESFNLYIDVMSNGKIAPQIKDAETLLKSKGLEDFKLDEKKALSTSTTLVLSVTLKKQEQGLKLLSLEGSVGETYSVKRCCQDHSSSDSIQYRRR